MILKPISLKSQLLFNKGACEVCEEPEYDEHQDVNIRRNT